jgi:hypothetical protein
VKRLALIFFALLALAPTFAAVVPAGAGSYADSIGPDSYGCVVDYGNWIVSAGVVQPGIAGCDPKGDYNGVPVGAPVKRYPQLVGKAALEPTATHRWWGSVAFYGGGQVNGSGAGYLTADPMMARVSNRGVRVLGIPNGLRVDPKRFVYPVPAPAEEVFDGIAIGNSQFSNLNAFMTDHSDGSVTVEWRSGATPVMQATLVHGSPYMFFEVFSGTPVIRTKAAQGPEKGVFFQSVNALGVWTDVASVRNHFMVVAEGATTFNNPTATETNFTPPGGKFTLVWLPVAAGATPSSTMISDFSQYALNRIAKVNITYAVNPSTQAVTISHDYLDGNGASVTTLAGLMPLQWKNTSQALGTHKTRSARGVIRFAPSSHFEYQLPFIGVLPLLPVTLGLPEEARLRTLVTQFVNEGSASWNRKLDTYWSGKAYGKVAEVAAIARSIGMNSEADALVNWLKSELSDWFRANNTGAQDKTKYFAYDKEWSTLLGLEESFGSHQQLNDHHFHYGYFIRAAAEVCRVDASWCSASAYGPMVELLIRDFAAGRDDPKFPYLRNFDPANGFSWASGHANFALGNNNESTSEAANAYGAIILYGLITNKQNLVDRGVYLHASTTAAYWEYWNNIDAYRGKTGDFNNFPTGYDRLATSIIWGAGADFSTWFSPAYAHILGIQGLPLNPLVLHIGQHADYLRAYAALGLSQSSNGQPSGLASGQWPDIWWNILAMTDPQRALDDFTSVNLNYTAEEGETKAHTYHWLQAFNALGTVESGKGTITADYPSAAVFSKNGLRTYVAYNMGSTPRLVSFSDRMAINVPANAIGIKRTGDSPDLPGNIDTQAPTPPGAPAVSNITSSSAVLSWTASSDNVGVVGYDLSVGGGNYSVANCCVLVDTLQPATQYTASVVARDAAGNRSSASTVNFVTASSPTGCSSNCVNLAQGRPATASSDGWGGAPARAVDGVVNGNYGGNSVTHTQFDTQAWWQVDLGLTSAIQTVEIFNRTDCCSGRLSDFFVFVSNTDMSGRTLAQLIADTNVARVQVATLNGSASVLLPLVSQGRFVKVQLAGSNYLSLAEVRVMGSAAALANLAEGRAATSSSVGWGGDAARAVDGNTDGNYYNNSVTHTLADVQPWWQVDLALSRAIQSVQLFNRTDCCVARLLNFYVFVSSSDMSGRTLAQLVADPAVARTRVATLDAAASITLPLAAQGRFVKVQLEGSDYLSLAEVRVLGQ